MKQWEYKLLNIYGPDLKSILDDLGKEGWELTYSTYNGDNYFDIVLKREKEHETEQDDVDFDDYDD